MFLVCGVIHPIWASPFDRISKGTFNNNIHQARQIQYLHSIGKTYGYYEDTEKQILEINCANNSMMMGIVLNREHATDYVLDDTKLHFYISNIKESVLEEVKIPIFKQDHKIRFTKTLKESNLKSVFIKVVAPELFPENSLLNDVVQNIRVIIDQTSLNTRDSNRGYRTVRKFIAERPFMYYFRLPSSNTIILVGLYN